MKEEIDESSNIKEIDLNSIPMSCLVEIAGYLDTDKKCLRYRNISKKFNEAIQMKLYMKTKDGDAEFYKKCFLILNSKCHNYYINNIYPFLLNADTVYEFFNFQNEELFNKLFNYCFKEIKNIIISNNLKLNLSNLEKNFKKTIIRFLVTIIIKNFEKEEYDSLDFQELAPYNDAKEMIILIVKLMKNLNYLNLNNIKVNDDLFLGKLLDKIDTKVQFTLLLEGIYIGTNLVKKIKMITDNNLDIKIKIDKKYNGQLNYLGGKKMNMKKIINKKKFKKLEFIK